MSGNIPFFPAAVDIEDLQQRIINFTSLIGELTVKLTNLEKKTEIPEQLFARAQQQRQTLRQKIETLQSKVDSLQRENGAAVIPHIAAGG